VSDQPAAATPHDIAARHFRKGLIEAFGAHQIALFATFVGIGSLGYGLGFPLWAVLFTTPMLNAGPAQVILISQIGAGASILATVLAVSMSSIRFVPMVVALMPMMRTPSTRLSSLLIASHFVAVTNWVEGLRRLPPLPPEGRLPYFVGFGLVIMATCVVGNVLGYFLARHLPSPLVAALFFMTPIYFTAAVARAIKWRGEWLAMAIGFSLTIIGASMEMNGFELVLAALIGGGAGFALYRFDKRSADHGA
jgi:predicted branched-subunit amino acid permease